MQYSSIPFEVKLPDQQDFTFDVHALHKCLENSWTNVAARAASMPRLRS